jgi:hypothetical protein
MDDIVKQAMAKWPNVPHCYGWLALDARGGWRMRDEAAQQANAPGDKLNSAALLGFINRNYGHDDAGRWYFQNGPQRVYVNLEATPYIARTDPAQGLVLQTGAALDRIERLFLTEAGVPIVQAGDVVAQIDDRDVAQLFEALELDGQLAGPGRAGRAHRRRGPGAALQLRTHAGALALIRPGADRPSPLSRRRRSSHRPRPAPKTGESVRFPSP